MSDMVRSFNELTTQGQSLAGGKGGTLARLHQAGYPVPDGFVILPAAFVDNDLTPEVWAQVQAYLERLRTANHGVAFAVRSSALSEDSAQASFAGEFETVLDVYSDDMIREAIRTVRRSRHSERVLAYSQAKDVDAAHDMAVVVQRLVRAEVSGVLFTADPVTGSHMSMIGNFVYGFGQELVSGNVEPYTFRLKRPRGQYDGPPELKRFARKLFKLATRLERELGRPQDIEWAIAGGKLFLLQSRPITTLMGFDPVTGEFNDSLTGDYVWSCVNVGEAVSVVMTPFTWSMMRTGFSELDILPGHSSVGNIGGRLYQNSTVMVSVLQALGKNFQEVAKEIGGVRDEYLETMDQYLVPLPEATLFAILPHALRVRRKEKAALKNVATFVAGNPGWCREMRHRIQAVRTRDELVSLMEDELWPRSLESFWRNYATALHYSERVAGLRRKLIEWVGAADADALLSNVSRQDELLASLGPLVGLARVARGQMQPEAYLERWGHRGALEAEVSAPRPAEDPDWLDQQLAVFAQSPVDVEGLLAAQRAEFDAAWQRFQKRYPRQTRSVRCRLDKAAEAAQTREAARSESARILWVVRTWVLRAGELTEIGDGAFFLTFDELLDLLAGKDTATAHIPARRRTYERYKALPPLPLLIRGRFDPFQWAGDPDRRSDVFDSHGLLPKLKLKSHRENVILGMPGAAGRVEGMVRRLDSPGDGDELEPGEILVTSQTNIGWTLFFPRAGAVVTDVGAPLSHAAIVARELGIPAVVNCGDATMRLKTGDRVRVDGEQGVVEILEVGGVQRMPGRKEEHITTLSGQDPASGEWNDSLTGDFLWSNVNFGEAVTEAMTPLAWTVLQFALDDWMFLPGHSTTGNIGGRPYLNISVFATLFHVLGRSRQDLLDMMEGTLYMRLPKEMEIPLIPLSRWALIGNLPNLMRLQIRQKRGVKTLPTYLATNLEWCHRMREGIQAEKSQAGLVTLWQGEIKPHVKQGVWTVLGTVNHSTDYTLRLRRELTTLVGPEDANVLIANLSDDSGILPSLGPVVGLAKVARGEMERGAYLEQYGHRGPHEFEISLPRPAEDLDWLDRQLAQFHVSPVDVDALLAKQQETFDAAWQRFLSRQPRKAKAMRRRMAESARRARLREEARSEYVRDRWVVRLFAVRAGELTGLGDDIFFLTLDELLDILSGDEAPIHHIPARREAYHRYKSLPAYPSIIRGRFDPFQWAADPHRRSDIFDSHVALPAAALAEGGSILSGSPGAAGRVEGTVRRLDSPEDGLQLQEGEVLVTVQTDIAWTLLFPRAAAIVTDVGAPLSHAAIVARELGIPAVVGCGDATTRLRTGDRVLVDGGLGTVEVLNAAH